MIDAATQILSAVKPSDNRSDRASENRMNTEDSGSSFNSVYKKSKSNISEKQPNQSTSKNDSPKTSTVTENVKKPTKLSKQEPSRDDKKNVKDNEEVQKKEEVNYTENTEKVSEENTKEEELVVSDAGLSAAETIEQEILDGMESLGLINEVAIKSESIKLDVEISKIENGSSNTENKDKLDVVAQSIIGEIKASIENVEKVKEQDKPVQLTRSKILENIKSILDIDVLNGSKIPEQLLKPDLSTNVNASKVLGEQLKAKDFNVNYKVDLEQKIEVIAESEDNPEIDEKTDLLLQKLIEKLDLSKVKSDKNSAFKLANIAADKASISEFVDQIAPKLSSESTGIGSISQMMGLSNRAGNTSPIQQFTMNTQLNQAEWGSEFSKRINFMITNDLKQVELRLDPPELGRINIKIIVSQDQASVAFSSAHSNVREAIDNALPRLRELLQESGIQLNDANINDRQQEKPNENEGNAQLSGPVLPALDDEAAIDETNHRELQHSVDGLIDYFA